MEYDFNILYYLNMYKKWWKTIVKLMAAAVFFTVIFSLLMPASYVSKVTIISTDSVGGGVSSVSSISKFFGIAGISKGTSYSDIIFVLLKSNRMTKDIKNFLELNKQPDLKYKINTREMIAGLEIEVKGANPAFTEKIANFIIQNLDRINGELDITPAKPMVKVLDPASYGEKESRQVIRKAFIAGLFAFLLISLHIFFYSYLKKIKLSQ
ncbi:MAG: hypothetical protein WC312_02495 [Candidatus Omnitrophota bacterium]|jgi:uncharacterized protein involved in exopolysaccharide biosynthesis